MTIDFLPVRVQDQELLAEVAGEIWNEYWPQHIGQAQTDYMVEQFQSLPAIQRQMAEEGYEYWFLTVPQGQSDSPWTAPDGRPIVGFTGGQALRQPRDPVLHRPVRAARPSRHVPDREQGQPDGHSLL